MQLLKKLGCFQFFSYDKLFKHLEPKFHNCTFEADNKGHMHKSFKTNTKNNIIL